MSDSVATACGDTRDAETSICGDELRVLREMERERRDEAWASQMEATLRSLLTSAPYAAYTVRNIECRSSICATEIASTYGRHPGLALKDLQRIGMDHGNGLFGYERNEYGERVTVTLRIFRRDRRL
jgi:hypothetical protein